MSVLISIAIGTGFLGLSGFAAYSGFQLQRSKRERFIREFVLPHGLFKKVQEKRPVLDPRHHALVARALRQFFLCHLMSGRKFVSMPSQVVDDLWHEFILFTRNYQQFCNKAFGGYMHHTPAVKLGKGQTDDIGLKRTWRYACLEENINPRTPSRLPLLFAIDAKLGIAEGFRYLPDCSKWKPDGRGDVHCGANLGVGCGGGGASGWGDSWFGSDSGGGFSDSGGSSCGGGGCGGGGCGGGGA
jgi:hypothetical protein